MSKAAYLSFLLIILSSTPYSPSLDDSFSQEKMIKDLEVFKNIRLSANSGLYKYRTKKQIDSIYHWADKEIKNSSTYREFYNIICHLTDFEGSLHNDSDLPQKRSQSLKNEESGYFPYPIKFIENAWINNHENDEIPLGAKIISINNEKIESIIKNVNKYYTTDGVNTTGKRIGIEYNFGKYYRLNYGLKNQFLIEYQTRNSDEIKSVNLKSVSNKDFYKNVSKRYSRPFDTTHYKNWEENETYTFETINKQTGILTINDFGLGNEKNPKHLRYAAFLDSVFAQIKQQKLNNLIVDVRHNGGGDDPNDLVTYSYLTQRNFQENTQAWISFNKVPYVRYAYTKVPRILRPLGVGKYNKVFQKDFPKEINGKYYQDASSNDHRVRKPNKNAFNGNVYLLIGPRVASAGSLFAAMVAGNNNTVVIGEETMGGYYGHNGHTKLGYILPKSKIETFFSVVNLEQDVPKKENQKYNRGVIPDYTITQTYEDYLNQKDTQLDFVFDLLKSKGTK